MALVTTTLRSLAGNANQLLSSRVTRPLSITPAVAVTPRRSLNTKAAAANGDHAYSRKLNPSLGDVSPLPKEGWEFKEDSKALYIKVELPGIAKEDVKVMVNPNEENVLVIKPKPKYMPMSEEVARKLMKRAVWLKFGVFKVDDSITAEMDKGVLTLTVPKVTNASDEFVPIKVN